MSKIFKLSEKTEKVKNKLVVLSLICLFIGLTKTLPTSINLIGMEFKNNQQIIGWVLFGITIFYLLQYIILIFIKLVIEKQWGISLVNDDIYKINIKDLEEKYEYFDKFNEEEYNPFQNIKNKYDNCIVKLYNIIIIFFDVIVPIILGVISLLCLFKFLKGV